MQGGVRGGCVVWWSGELGSGAALVLCCAVKILRSLRDTAAAGQRRQGGGGRVRMHRGGDVGRNRRMREARVSHHNSSSWCIRPAAAAMRKPLHQYSTAGRCPTRATSAFSGPCTPA
ncbi:hypothetical protein PLESTB_000080600 [Pleodorina starrii]|uniref:Uncharacterized protein n=1 Tax=Pleodorina starrii TaxID=330485 RepID=A0A9W6BAM3_9CHLO|nr:hypothetical protein PLESTB_000080600 [Pleodorina starrii]